jgi:hypothetical protein
MLVGKCTESLPYSVSSTLEHRNIYHSDATFEYVMQKYHGLRTSNEVAWMIWPKELRFVKSLNGISSVTLLHISLSILFYSRKRYTNCYIPILGCPNEEVIHFSVG